MQRQNSNIRLQDIARETKYSISTVAKVLAGSAKAARISNGAVDEILLAAKRLGYKPNLIARKLRSKKSGLVGIALANATDAIISMTLTAILQELHPRGLLPLLSVEGEGIMSQHEAWMKNNIEGLIVCGPAGILASEHFDELMPYDAPIVIAGNPFFSASNILEATRIGIVQIDNRKGISLAIDHLVDIGRRRIAFINGPSWHSDAFERQIAYRDLIAKHHPPVTADSGETELYWKRGYLSARDLLNAEQSIDAIIAYDDNVALGAIKYITDTGRNIPDDIAVMGFDNQPQAEYSIPSLTTIDQPTALLGKASVELLEKLIRKKDVAERHIYIEPTLVVRASTVE